MKYTIAKIAASFILFFGMLLFILPILGVEPMLRSNESNLDVINLGLTAMCFGTIIWFWATIADHFDID